MSARRITFEAGENQMSLDPELEQREEQKAALLDEAESGWLHDDKKTSVNQGNVREFVDATFPKIADIKEKLTSGSHLWAIIKTRFPGKTDRYILADAYNDNFLPPLLEKHADLWEEETKAESQGYKLPWAKQEEMELLNKKIQSAQKLVAFMELYEAEQDQADLARIEAEQAHKAKAEAEAKTKDQAQILALNFGLQSFETRRSNQPPIKHKLPEYAAAIGKDFEGDTYVLAPDEQREDIDRAIATLRKQVVSAYPNETDRRLLFKQLEEDVLKASLEYEKLAAQNALHERSEEQIAEERAMEAAVIKKQRVVVALGKAFPGSDINSPFTTI